MCCPYKLLNLLQLLEKVFASFLQLFFHNYRALKRQGRLLKGPPKEPNRGPIQPSIVPPNKPIKGAVRPFYVPQRWATYMTFLRTKYLGFLEPFMVLLAPHRSSEIIRFVQSLNGSFPINGLLPIRGLLAPSLQRKLSYLVMGFGSQGNNSYLVGNQS